MNGTNDTNGRKHLPWLIAVCAPTLLGVVVGWVGSINIRVTNHAERIAVIESQLKDTRDELHNINQKLDQLLRRP